jgi:putative ABC transport system permease protein
MDLLWTECKRAVRGIASRPGFSALTLVTLGLGIGLNTAIFSLVYAALLKALPYREPGRIVRVWESRPQMGPDAARMAAFSMDHFRAWRDSNDVFSAIAVYQDQSFNLTGGSEPIRIDGERVSPELFPLLGVDPLFGRVFDKDEETPGRDRVAVLSEALWRRLFGADESIVGRAVHLDGLAYTVVGVMPREFRFPAPATEIWVPLPATTPAPTRPGEFRIELVPVIGKLLPGVGIEKATQEGQAFLDHFREGSPMAREMGQQVTIRLTSLHEQLARPIRPALLALFGAVSFVLLIVCANVAHLFLARAQRRETEMAVRSALGAGRGRLVSELLTETLLYALSGGALGVLVAHASLRLFLFLAPRDLDVLDHVGLDVPVLAFNLAVALATAILVGLVPALRASRVDVVDGLKALSQSSPRPRGVRSRNALATAEVALALVLFTAAGLMARSFLALSETDPGYRPDGVLTFRIDLPSSKYESAASERAFFDRLDERLRDLPGASASGIVNILPLDRARMITMIAVEGRPPVTDRMQMPRASVRVAGPGYLEAMGIRILGGRGFRESDREGTPPVVLINESLARRYFEGEDPLGKRFHRMGEIVGVVADVRQEGLDAEPEPELYLHYRQLPDEMREAIAGMGVAVRFDPEAPPFVEAVKAAVRDLDAELPLDDLRTMSARLSDSVARPRLYAVLFAIFAAMALVVAASGVYSVVSYQVAERTREHGLRMALGATSNDVLKLVMGNAVRVLVLGVGLGLAAALLLGGFLRSVLYRIEPYDALTLVSVSVVLGAVVLLASGIPARQAARSDPMKALRYE